MSTSEAKKLNMERRSMQDFSPLIHGNVPFQRKVAPGTGTRGAKIRQIKSFNSGKLNCFSVQKCH